MEKGGPVEEERFVFITRAVASFNGSVGGCAGYGGRGFARWLGD